MAITCAKLAIWGSTSGIWFSQGTNVILSWQRADSARHLQLEERCEDLRGGQLVLEEIEDLVDLQRSIGMKNLENHGFIRSQSRFREKRCWRVSFGFKAGFSLKLKSYLRREIFPHVLPGGDELGALLDQGVGGPGAFVSDVAGYGVEVTVLVGGATGGDTGAGVLAGLDDKYRNAETAEDAIAAEKVLRRGKCAELHFVDDGAPVARISSASFLFSLG